MLLSVLDEDVYPLRFVENARRGCYRTLRVEAEVVNGDANSLLWDLALAGMVESC